MQKSDVPAELRNSTQSQVKLATDINGILGGRGIHKKLPEVVETGKAFCDVIFQRYAPDNPKSERLPTARTSADAAMTRPSPVRELSIAILRDHLIISYA